jgi:hypothetical protein
METRVVAQSWDMSWGGTALVPIPLNLGNAGRGQLSLERRATPVDHWWVAQPARSST